MELFDGGSVEKLNFENEKIASNIIVPKPITQNCLPETTLNMLADFVVDSSGDTKRTDKSLGILTRKFVQILQKTSNGVLDLKYVSICGVGTVLSFGFRFLTIK